MPQTNPDRPPYRLKPEERERFILDRVIGQLGNATVRYSALRGREVQEIRGRALGIARPLTGAPAMTRSLVIQVPGRWDLVSISLATIYVRPKPLVIGLDSDLLGHQDSNVVAATESALARYGLDAGVALVDDEPRRPWWARRKAGAR